jgi:hypothetical protein
LFLFFVVAGLLLALVRLLCASFAQANFGRELFSNQPSKAMCSEFYGDGIHLAPVNDLLDNVFGNDPFLGPNNPLGYCFVVSGFPADFY